MPALFDIGTTPGTVAAGDLYVPNTILTTRGDLLRAGVSGAEERVALGSTGKVVGSDGTDAVWVAKPLVASAETFSSARAINSVTLVSILSAAYTIPAGLRVVGDQVIFEGAATVSNTAGANRTYSMNVGPFMATDWACPAAHATATVRIYTWRLVTTIVSSTAQATIGQFNESSPGTAGAVFDVATTKIWNATSTVNTASTSTYDVKMLSTSASGTQEASLVSASLQYIPKGTWA